MMNQLYEDKCDCTQYNKMKDHCSSLIKMDLPEYEESQYNRTRLTGTLRVARLFCCVAVVTLLGYSLWRIQVLDARVANISAENFALKYGNRNYSRAKRAVDVSGVNSFTESMGTKDSSSDESIQTTTQKPRSHIQRPNKENYDKLIDELFDKMYVLRRDSDKRHLRKNIRAVFEAWSAVFDAAVPYEMVDEDVRQRRSVIVDPSSEESSEEHKNKKGLRERRSVNQDPISSEESSEEQKKQGETKPLKQKKVKDGNSKQSSEESSEEKNRNKRSIDRSDEEPCESSEEKSKDGLKCKKNSKKEESSEEVKEEQKGEQNSNESKERSESQESQENKGDER